MLFNWLLIVGVTHANPLTCDNIKTSKDFYLCSLDKHPKYQVSQLKRVEGEAFVEKASQWKNPNLELKSVGGEKSGEKVGSTELSLSLPLSQAWTRGATIDVAEADQKIAQIESKEALFQTQRELIHDLYRWRQLETELELVNETLSTFDVIRRQYHGRLARGPEQEITLNLVELATSDYELKKNHLTTERIEILSRFRAMWGPQFSFQKEFLPPLREAWPEISTSTLESNFTIQKANAENQKAQAEHRLSVRESWPEMYVGPTIERNTEGPTQYTNYGVNFSMSVPLLSFNGGARKLTEAKALQTQLVSDWAAKKADADREILIQKYRSSVESLRKSSNQSMINNKHKKIDTLFRQGLASGGLIIEAHRQITEYTESQHEHENAAIEAFLEIKALSGGTAEEVFQ